MNTQKKIIEIVEKVMYEMGYITRPHADCTDDFLIELESELAELDKEQDKLIQSELAALKEKLYKGQTFGKDSYIKKGEDLSKYALQGKEQTAENHDLKEKCDPRMKDGSFYKFDCYDVAKDLWGNINCELLIDPKSCGRELSCACCERYVPYIGNKGDKEQTTEKIVSELCKAYREWRKVLGNDKLLAEAISKKIDILQNVYDKEYATQKQSVVLPTEGDIEKEFPRFYNDRFHRKNTTNELNIAKIGGAHWVIEWINNKNK